MPGMGYFSEALAYLVNLIFSLYLLAVILRFLLQMVRADFYNPICVALVAVTDPVLRFFRPWIPAFWGIDWAAIVLMVLLQMGEIILLLLLRSDQFPALLHLLPIAFSSLLRVFIYVYMFIIILQAIMSWIQPGVYSPFVILLHQLSRPLLSRIRYYIPAMHGIDWSPLVLLVVLNLMLILLVAPLYDWGLHLLN